MGQHGGIGADPVVGQRLPHRAPVHVMLVREFSDRQLLNPPVTPDLLDKCLDREAACLELRKRIEALLARENTLWLSVQKKKEDKSKRYDQPHCCMPDW